MSETKTGPAIFDPTDYWTASAQAKELLAIPNDQITDAHREAYATSIAVIEEAAASIAEGQTTGKGIIDRLIASGQIVSVEQLEHLSTTEQMLILGEPVLLQQGKAWKLGIVCHDELYFSRVSRNSFFAPAARGYQAIPVRSYVELDIDPLIDHIEGYDRIDVRSIQPDDLPPEVGRGIGLPLTPVGHMPFKGEHKAPQGVLDMWRTYDQTFGWPINEHGGRSHHDMLHVGREAVEINLGMTLEEILGFTENTAILDYVTRPTSEQ